MTGATWLLDDVRLVPMDGPPAAPLGDVRRGAIRIAGDRIVEVGALAPRAGERVVAGRGRTALPGFVQGHVHATQTLFRGLADDLPLLAWLEQRIWPLEHAHDEASTRASARLTFAELLAGGTTTVMTMESVRHAEVVGEQALAAGLTAIVGNCLMDLAADGVPAGMPTTAREGIELAAALADAFDGRDGRLEVAVAPRFVLSCSDELLHASTDLAARRGLRVHTHAGEHPSEVAAVRARFGSDNVEALHAFGLLGPRTALAHCVHTTARERELLAATGTAVLHCPSTNLKLGSGIAPIAAYRSLGLRIAIGADGAPCNNRLSMPTELRLAALLQNVAATPGAFSAEQALWTATRGGAEALGLGDRVGSLAPGRRADLLLFDLDDASLPLAPTTPAALASALVYSADERHLRTVFCGGACVVDDGRLLAFDRAAARAEAAAALPAVLQRAGLAR